MVAPKLKLKVSGKGVGEGRKHTSSSFSSNDDINTLASRGPRGDPIATPLIWIRAGWQVACLLPQICSLDILSP